MIEPAAEIRAALTQMGLAGAQGDFAMKQLDGGVSCDVFVVDLPGRRVCVKRALSKLRVEADWHAPAKRAEAEVAWIRLVAGIDPQWVPAILGEDRARHLFVMEFLPPENHPVWKSLLAEGRIDADFAAKVGAALARIHAETAGRADVAAAFASDAQFHALRIEPYLLHTASNNPDMAAPIRAMANGVASARIALMHGDVSPKNILCAPHGPVFLDAECACYGDPAFDLAFCLNHLLLKGAWHPEHGDALAAAFVALKSAYFKGAIWEARDALDRRVAGLLSALLLARIDGKSPAEYLTDAHVKSFVRAQAKLSLADPAPTLDSLLDRWTAALSARA